MSTTPSKKFSTCSSECIAQALYVNEDRHQTLQSQYDRLQDEFESSKRDHQARVQVLYCMWRSEFPHVGPNQ